MTGEETIKILKEYQKTHPETANFIVGPDLSKKMTPEMRNKLIETIKKKFPNLEENVLIYEKNLNSDK